jgi:hypothetical protein
LLRNLLPLPQRCKVKRMTWPMRSDNSRLTNIRKNWLRAGDRLGAVLTPRRGDTDLRRLAVMSGSSLPTASAASCSGQTRRSFIYRLSRIWRPMTRVRLWPVSARCLARPDSPSPHQAEDRRRPVADRRRAEGFATHCELERPFLRGGCPVDYGDMNRPGNRGGWLV